MLLPTADQLRGRATGSLFFAVFGSAWLALWLAATQQLRAATGSVIGGGLVGLVLAGVWVLRHAHRLPAAPLGPDAAAREQREGRLFWVVNAGQWGAMALAVGLLPRWGHPDYVTPAVALIVGLHFLPLARLFRYRGHYLTGGTILAWALGCLWCVPQPEWQSRVALGTGLILWLSAGYALTRAVYTLAQLPRTGPRREGRENPLTSGKRSSSKCYQRPFTCCKRRIKTRKRASYYVF